MSLSTIVHHSASLSGDQLIAAAVTHTPHLYSQQTYPFIKKPKLWLHFKKRPTT